MKTKIHNILCKINTYRLYCIYFHLINNDFYESNEECNNIYIFDRNHYQGPWLSFNSKDYEFANLYKINGHYRSGKSFSIQINLSAFDWEETVEEDEN